MYPVDQKPPLFGNRVRFVKSHKGAALEGKFHRCQIEAALYLCDVSNIPLKPREGGKIHPAFSIYKSLQIARGLSIHKSLF